ncbi:MAG TPA: hypothetical protein VM689_07075 [Aliidongia sp.]|nr:hypothetical protein [Aliidongia sp.]
MKATGHEPPKSPEEWIEVATRELTNLRGSYLASLSNDAKVDHAVRAIEAILKAIIWKHENFQEWPKVGHKTFGFLFKHNLQAMLDHCGLRTRLRASGDHWASWATLVNAVERQARYSPTPSIPSDEEANQVAKAVRHPDSGIVPWLLKRYHEMI